MPSVFLVSDTHFGHMGVCKFTRNDGVTKLRPYSTPEEMMIFMTSGTSPAATNKVQVYDSAAWVNLH